MREQDSAITMNRREMLKLSAFTALIGTSAIPSKTQATQTVPVKQVSLPDPPPKPSTAVAAKLFPGYTQTDVRTSRATIPVFHKGDGPALLLLHGYPETHVTWHKVAPRLAARYSVYSPDLRGYGDSSRPSDGDRHVHYWFRAMALDRVETMRHFGNERFLVGAGDRGARVAHRLCLDFPRKREQGLPHGHRSDVDDVSTNQSRVRYQVHVAVLPYPSGASAPTSDWARFSLLSGRHPWRTEQDAGRPHAGRSERGCSTLLLHIDDSCHVRRLQSGCGCRSCDGRGG
jgi:pimeloyl-ACP methyl ester carboxylesterase